MKRREFLLTAAWLSMGLFFPVTTEAVRLSDRPKHPHEKVQEEKDKKEQEALGSDVFINMDLPDVIVRETNLSFGPMDRRFVTEGIVIHHIGNTNSDVSASTVHQWHIQQGWSGIGYHFLIRKNGVIERGRPMDAVGAHAYGSNRNTIGINVVGNFETALPTKAQIDAVVDLATDLCKAYRIRPSSRTIIGHRDVNSTLCPGKSLYEMLPIIRQRVQEQAGDIEENPRMAALEEENKAEMDREGGGLNGNISQHEERPVSRRSRSKKTLAGGKTNI